MRRNMVEFQPRQIIGKWKQGFALDLHTLSSTPLGYNEYGHLQFDTIRSELGNLLYELKYHSDQKSIRKIVKAAEKFIKEIWVINVDIIIPVPPSTKRKLQPVLVLAEKISNKLGIPLSNCVTRKRNTPQLKNVYDLDERLKLLDDLHKVDKSATKNKRVLLFDDLYRSGATMNAITTDLYEKGRVADVFALTITKTRSNQ